jgi:SH3-like domain-containing protein
MDRNICKRIQLVILMVSVFLFCLSGCKSETTDIIQSEIDSVSARLLSDRREEICNIRALQGEDGSVILHGETTNPKLHSELINTLNESGILFTDSIINLPDTTINKKYFGLVTLSVINLRKFPEHSAELVSQAILGTPVLILKEEDSWLLIQTPDKYISWTEKSSLKLLTRSELTRWRNSERVIFLSCSGWVYSTESEKDVIGDLVSGAVLETKGRSGDYVKILFPDGREGFVKSDLVAPFNTWKKSISLSQESIVSVARTFMGLPYLWGGSSSKSVDCSGFVQSVYFRNGIILSRDASLQAQHGEVVDITSGFSNLKTGDLLFFGSKGKNGARVTHVAIYLGDYEFIHASSRVMINSLDSTRNNYSGYRRNSILSARRICGVTEDPGIALISSHKWY